jgi:hypothetical protein
MYRLQLRLQRILRFVGSAQLPILARFPIRLSYRAAFAQRLSAFF